MKMKSKKFLVGISMLITMVLLTGCVESPTDVGNVNGETISINTYEVALAQAKTTVQSEVKAPEDGSSVWKVKLEDGRTAEQKAKDDAFDACVKQIVQMQKATELGIAVDQAGKDEISSQKAYYISAIEQQYGSKLAFSELLKAQGITEEEFDKQLEQSWVVNKLREKIMAETPALTATDEEINTTFKKDYIKAKHILIMITPADQNGTVTDQEKAAAKTKADEVITKLNAGGNFDALMKEYSGDVTQTGELNSPEGYVFKSGDFGNPAFEEASFKLEVGKYTTEPVYVSGGYSGYHIILRVETTDADKESKKDTVKKSVEDEKYDTQYLKDLIAAAKINKDARVIKYTKIEEKAAAK